MTLFRGKVRSFWTAAVLVGAVACSGGSGDASSGGDGAAAVSIPVERLDQSWVVKLATQEDLAPFVANPGWASLLVKRDYEDAARKFAKLGGPAAGRAHAELAAVYRQGALLSSNALLETYGKTPEPTDPVGAAHLLTVAYVLNGDLAKAKEASAKLDGLDDPSMAWHGPWKTWLAGDATWPPDLSGLPLEVPAVAPGSIPEAGSLPHYALPETGADSTREMGDPGALVALALWHEQAARAALGDQAALVDVYQAGYRFPIEQVKPSDVALPMEFQFASDLIVPEDANFLAAVYGPSGVAAIEQYKDRSLLAWLASASRVGGKIQAERAVDLVNALREQLVERAAARTEGNVQHDQRMFADIVMVGTFRNLALVAEVEGDRETSGLLRINAMERSSKSTADPVGLLALGAWDASNRYPTRAQEILHSQARVFPSLEVARYGLDVMALRVSRERTGETPGM